MEENLSVLSGWIRWSNAQNTLYNHLSDQAFQLLGERESRIARLKSYGQWIRRQKEVSETLMEIVGPFPEKNPLNPKITGVLKREGYRVEKVIYESMPEFYVTACLYVPNNLRGKTPAILYPCGHTTDGYRADSYQTAAINLVMKGFIVLTYDPAGQGERLQYFDPEKGSSVIGGPTHEHSYAGAQCFISGSSFARYRIWDGIRSVDYLMTRDEVDPDRIGLTGRSGGGTMTSYIGAFDDRILAAAPECYISGFRRLLESIGPQDAEQNFYHGIARDIDHADLLEVRAPKPCMIIATTRDMFSIQGVREVFDEVRKAYEAFGKAENITIVEDDAPHQTTLKNREAMYAFFQKHLKLPGDSRDEKIQLSSPEELNVTSTGQVSISLGGKTVFEINCSETQELLARKGTAGKESAKSSAIRLSGYMQPDRPPEAVFTGRHIREGYSVEKYMISGEGDYVIPSLLMIPDGGGKHPPIIYIRPEGKAFKASIGYDMESLVKKGYAVIAPDLIGIGETGAGNFKGDAYIGDISYGLWFGAILIGRSILGIRAGDIIRVARYLESRGDIEYDNISAIAYGEMCPVLLHAAAFDDSIAKVALVEPLISYKSIVTNRYYAPGLIHATVAGALTSYDLPDLAACIAPRKLSMVNVTDQNKKIIDADSAEKELSAVRLAYANSDAEKMFEIICCEGKQAVDNIF